MNYTLDDGNLTKTMSRVIFRINYTVHPSITRLVIFSHSNVKITIEILSRTKSVDVGWSFFEPWIPGGVVLCKFVWLLVCAHKIFCKVKFSGLTFENIWGRFDQIKTRFWEKWQKGLRHFHSTQFNLLLIMGQGSQRKNAFALYQILSILKVISCCNLSYTL